MAVALGLLAALTWGLADFLIRIAGRTVGVHRSMLYAQGLGAVSLGLWLACDAAAQQALRDPPVWAIAAAVGASAFGFVATVALYRAFQVGRVGLVSPIAGAYGAVTAAMSLVSGEAVGWVATAGIAVIVAGIMLVAAPADGPFDRKTMGPGNRTGIGLAIVACTGFGVSFWILGQFATPRLGAVVPVWIYYMFSSSALLLAAGIRRPSLALSPLQAISVFAAGAMAVAGFVVLSAGLATGQVAIVTVLSSLQSAVTVGLACSLLNERMARHQWVGVAAIVAGLGLVRLAHS